MVVLSIIYPCNFGCPSCPYTDGNSEIRRFYRERGGDVLPESLWRKIAAEAGPHRAWLRCTGGGEPMLHPRMVEMVEHAKALGARVWLNTNGSLFGPGPKLRRRLERLVGAGIDVIEFSMDAGDAATYALLRPPRRGAPRDPDQWWRRHVGNVEAALRLREASGKGTRVVVSIIAQQAIEGRLDAARSFWLDDVGVDEVLTRKFLTWDDHTTISTEQSLDPVLYADLPTSRAEPCVWPFERLNVDTLGRVALCGQDVSFRTARLFPSAHEASISEIWQGERFRAYRELHLARRGGECWPCAGCSAWLAGVRDWEHGWQRVLRTAAERSRRTRSPSG